MLHSSMGKTNQNQDVTPFFLASISKQKQTFILPCMGWVIFEQLTSLNSYIRILLIFSTFSTGVQIYFTVGSQCWLRQWLPLSSKEIVNNPTPLTSSCKLTSSSRICAHLSLCLALLWPEICRRLQIGRTARVIRASTYCFTSELLYMGALKINPHKIFQRKIVNIFLPLILSICFGWEIRN